MRALSLHRLKQVLHYDPASGVFCWAENRKKCTKGAVAGSVRADGYVLIRIDYQRYYAHRLAWLYMTGEWPAQEIDHADGNPSNNVWSNLRAASPTQNMQNRPTQRNNRTGLKGVRRSSRGFYATIQVDGQYRYLGRFCDPLEAHLAYCQTASAVFGEFARFS
ncbi:HNH endonuclease [Sinorhizobium medicae]|nr:HNH endonuclease [Sinorhizobium medicae]